MLLLHLSVVSNVLSDASMVVSFGRPDTVRVVNLLFRQRNDIRLSRPVKFSEVRLLLEQSSTRSAVKS